MDRQPFLHDFQHRLLDLFRASPAADLERNLKALVNQTFNKLELVTREEFDIQRDLLRELSARVEALEVETLRAGTPKDDGAGKRTGSAGPVEPPSSGDGFYPGVGGSSA